MIELKRTTSIMERLFSQFYEMYEEVLYEDYRYGINQVEARIDNPNYHATIVEVDGKEIGTCTYWTLGKFLFIEQLTFMPKYRNKGYGKRVLDFIKEKYDMPIVSLVLKPKQDLNAIRHLGFFEKNGFLFVHGTMFKTCYSEAKEAEILDCLIVTNNYDFVVKNIYDVKNGMKSVLFM